jgi:hypothetical protein
VMELLETDLHRVKAKPYRTREDVVPYIMYQIVKAVRTLHSCGIVHRDLKAPNILMDNRNHTFVSDFGLAVCLKDPSSMDELTEKVGTLAYMAPEMMMTDLDFGYSKPVDIWAIGCMLAELLRNGHPLFARYDLMSTKQTIVDILGYPKQQDILDMGLDMKGVDRPLYTAVWMESTHEILKEYFPSAPWHALDFLRLCWQYNPVRRPTADQLLKHPFLSEFAWIDDCPEIPLGEVGIPLPHDMLVSPREYLRLIYKAFNMRCAPEEYPESILFYEEETAIPSRASQENEVPAEPTIVQPAANYDPWALPEQPKAGLSQLIPATNNGWGVTDISIDKRSTRKYGLPARESEEVVIPHVEDPVSPYQPSKRQRRKQFRRKLRRAREGKLFTKSGGSSNQVPKLLCTGVLNNAPSQTIVTVPPHASASWLIPTSDPFFFEEPDNRPTQNFTITSSVGIPVQLPEKTPCFAQPHAAVHSLLSASWYLPNEDPFFFDEYDEQATRKLTFTCCDMSLPAQVSHRLCNVVTPPLEDPVSSARPSKRLRRKQYRRKLRRARQGTLFQTKGATPDNQVGTAGVTLCIRVFGKAPTTTQPIVPIAWHAAASWSQNDQPTQKFSAPPCGGSVAILSAKITNGSTPHVDHQHIASPPSRRYPREQHKFNFVFSTELSPPKPPSRIFPHHLELHRPSEYDIIKRSSYSGKHPLTTDNRAA